MSSPFLDLAAALALATATLPADAQETLRVCADPNNLPFSNERGEGYENRLAEMLAEELIMRVEYTWWAQRRGFIRNTVKAGLCDVVMSVPVGADQLALTRPYYRSGYVFVWREKDGPAVHSFDDPALRRVKVGIQLIGDDGFNTPPAHALSRRAIIDNVRGYTVYGDYAQANPAARVVEAVAEREIDVAVAWGPLAGYFAQRLPTPIALAPTEATDGPLRFAFDIAVGVRRDAPMLRARIDEALERRRPDIARLLDGYGIPRLTSPAPDR